MSLFPLYSRLDEKQLKHLIINLFVFLFSGTAFAQSRLCNLKGHIKDAQGEILPGVIVRIEELKLATTTDEHGHYELKEVPLGQHLLTIQNMGYKTIRYTMILSHAEQHKHFVLEEEVMSTDEVTVQIQSKTQDAKEQPIKAEVVDTKEVKEQPVSLNELMGRSAGIRIRQTGGMGSSANILMNGYQGRSIKFFKDGVPMTYLGAGFDISTVPVNMLERVEVYKGVLPIHLGADALGGALNLVSKSTLPKYAEVSYEYGSFNTHRATLNAFYNDTARHVFVGTDAFFNHSDNNYRVMASVEDTATANLRPAEVELFHNKYTSYYAEVYGGIRRTKWTDELRLGFTGFLIDRQNQYGTQMTTNPFGASTSGQYSWIPTLRYQKSFWNHRLQADQFFSYNTLYVQQVDTAKGVYDWYGRFFSSPSRKGEMTQDGSLAKIEYTYFTSRTHLAFALHPTQKLEFNAVYIGMGMVGSDPFGKKFSDSKRDILSVPASYNKAIFSLGLSSKVWKQRISNVLIFKYYRFTTDFVEAVGWPAREQDGTTQKSRWGVAEAVKLAISPRSFIRASAELATRLPEQDEIFGDGNLQLSNLQLKPERSVNVNLGFRTEKSQKYTVEANAFYRVTHDLILNVAPVNFMFSQHQNVDEVKGIGFETDASVHLAKWLKANGNFTYQDFRLFDTGFPSTEGARLKNTPYFFANLGLNSQHAFLTRHKLQLYWYFSFVREYYLDYIQVNKEPDGFLGLWGKARFEAPNIIPNQHLHTVGFTYSPLPRLSFGFQAKNIFDASIYNNFKVQNAGRSFHLKINYLIR